MKEFTELLEVANRLQGPQGCPWDQKQTFQSLSSYVLEEAHEVIDAVDRGVDADIVEELGDLLYTVVFYGKIGEKEGRFSLDDIVRTVKEKLIRRHPHVFVENKEISVEEVKTRWEAIKKEEKKEPQQVTRTLPALQKVQKMLKKTKSAVLKEINPITEEEKLISQLVAIARIANEEEIDLEVSLTTFCNRILARN